MQNKKLPQSDQSQRFIQDARAFGADNNQSNADALMAKLAKTPPDPKPAKGSKAQKPAK